MKHAESVDKTDTGAEIDLLLQCCANQAIRLADSASFLQWIGKYGPDLMPRLAAQVDPATGTTLQFFHMLGREIWAAIPLPHKKFARERLADPGRNEACYCGSGRKFKQCCGQIPLAAASVFPRIEMLPYVLDALPKKRWAELPDSSVARDSVAATAFMFLDEDRPEDAVKLLEPWFSGEGRWLNHLAELFDLLLDAYEALDKRKKRKAMARAATERGEPLVAAIGWQRLAAMLSDEGDHAGAWTALGHAQRADPDNVSLGMLEVTMLLSAKDWEQARRRAQFWAARVAKMHGQQEAGVIDYLRCVAADPQQALEQMNAQRVPGLGVLMTLLDKAPAVACEFRVTPQDGLTGPLEPVPALKKVRRAWDEAFPSARPFSVQMSSYNEAPWPVADQWLAVLGKHPVLWQDFHVLDDLVCALDGLNTLGADKSVRRITDRALALLDCVLTDQHATGMPLEWGFLENRPALRLVVRHILDRQDEGNAEAAFPWLERMVKVLNPNDNHGLRDLLMSLYLQQEKIDLAIELGDRYPDDFGGMRYHRALAHFLLGDMMQADAILRDALETYPLIGRTLLAARASAPKEGPVELGSQNEANIYRAEYASLWNDDALAWLKGARSKARRQQSGRSA